MDIFSIMSPSVVCANQMPNSNRWKSLKTFRKIQSGATCCRTVEGYTNRGFDLPPVSAYTRLRNIARRRSCDKVGNAGSVFQVGEAHVLGIALLFVDGRELAWRSIAQAAVWPLFVVLRLPV